MKSVPVQSPLTLSGDQYQNVNNNPNIIQTGRYQSPPPNSGGDGGGNTNTPNINNVMSPGNNSPSNNSNTTPGHVLLTSSGQFHKYQQTHKQFHQQLKNQLQQYQFKKKSNSMNSINGYPNNNNSSTNNTNDSSPAVTTHSNSRSTTNAKLIRESTTEPTIPYSSVEYSHYRPDNTDNNFNYNTNIYNHRRRRSDQRTTSESGGLYTSPPPPSKQYSKTDILLQERSDRQKLRNTINQLEVFFVHSICISIHPRIV